LFYEAWTLQVPLSAVAGRINVNGLPVLICRGTMSARAPAASSRRPTTAGRAEPLAKPVVVLAGRKHSQIKFNVDGEQYLLLTAMPATRIDHVWVTRDPQYKLSEHMQGASDARSMFMVRSLSRHLEQEIKH
jgi:hypothetical protein